MSKPTGKPNGRPSTYTKELADMVCRLVGEGLSLVSVCSRDGMPSKGAFLHWVEQNRGELRDQYARARDRCLESRADEIVDISDDDSRDAQTPQAIQRDRLRVEARKWELAKLMPKKYGDKTTLEHQGKDGGAINIIISKDDAAHLGLSDEDKSDDEDNPVHDDHDNHDSHDDDAEGEG